MTQSIRAQALLLLLAFALGAGLGLLYDLLRPLRRRTGDALWDLLFCAAAALGCFCFAMRSEHGRLGSGELAASLAGSLLAQQRTEGRKACFPDRSEEVVEGAKRRTTTGRGKWRREKWGVLSV